MRCPMKLHLMALFVLLPATNGWSQAVARKEAEPELITEVYRVTDMVLPTPDYSFDGIRLPGSGANVWW